MNLPHGEPVDLPGWISSDHDGLVLLVDGCGRSVYQLVVTDIAVRMALGELATERMRVRVQGILVHHPGKLFIIVESFEKGEE